MKGWTRTTLGESCEIVSGATPSTSVDDYWDGDVFWATPKDLSDLGGTRISLTARGITEAGLASCSSTVLPPGSVLFSSRAPIGHVAINAVPMATNQGFKSFIPKPDRLYAAYLYWRLRTNRPYLESLGNGATFKEVSKAIVSSVEIPLPPLSDQRRIAEILDRADALRAKRRAALAQVAGLTQAIFLEMFGDPVSNPKRWPIGRIRDLLESASYGTSEKAGPTGDYPVLRMNNVTTAGEIDLSDLKFMSLPDAARERYTVRRGDVLFNRTNSADLVGKSALYRGTEAMAYAGYLVRLRVNQDNLGEYLAAFLNSAYAKAELRRMCKSIIGMANINASEIQAMPIAQPPLSLQRSFARRAAAVDGLKSSHRASLAQLDALFASLQHRAFRGEV